MEQPRNGSGIFYFHLILRDLFGRIVPGFALLSSVVFSLSPSKGFSAYNESSAGIWIVLLSASWTIGYALQGLGESHGWILTRPEQIHAKIALTREMAFYQIATTEEKHAYDRLGSIKEACGNGYLALSVSLLLLAICSLIRALQNKSILHVEEILYAVIILILAAGAIWYLRHMHRVHSDKQSKWIEESLRFHRPEWLARLEEFKEKGLVGEFELERMQAIIPNDHLSPMQ
jgi:hypothetical protein